MFSNISPAANVASTLLSQFGKCTKVLLEVTGTKITVRRCWDSKTIATINVWNDFDAALVYTPGNDVPTEFRGMEINHELAPWLMSRNVWPRAGSNERSWSRASYKEEWA